MKCAGCKTQTDFVLRHNTDIALCSSCTRLTKEYAAFHHIRNPLPTESVSWAARPDCVCCGFKTLPGADVCVLCLSSLLSYLFHLGVTLSDNPFVYRLIEPHREWQAAWEERVRLSTNFAREGVYSFYPRYRMELEYVDFVGLTGVEAELVDESKNNFQEALDFL